jgi:hypothetical protein
LDGGKVDREREQQARQAFGVVNESPKKAYYGDTCTASINRIQEPSAYEATLREQLYKKRDVLLGQLREIDECLQSLSEPTVQKVLRVISVAQ